MKRLFLIVLAVVFGCALAAQANLLLNPSFELQSSAGYWSPTNWTRSDGNDRTDTLAWGAQWVHDGSNVMRLSRIGGVPTDHNLNQDVSVAMVVGDVVTFSFYAFAQDNSSFSNAFVDIGLKNGAGGDVWYSGLNFTTALSNQSYASGWVQHTFMVTNTSVGANQVSLWLNVKGFNDVAGNADVMFDSADLTVAIPEPSSAALIGIAGLTICMLRKRFKS